MWDRASLKTRPPGVEGFSWDPRRASPFRGVQMDPAGDAREAGLHGGSCQQCLRKAIHCPVQPSRLVADSSVLAGAPRRAGQPSVGSGLVLGNAPPYEVQPATVQPGCVWTQVSDTPWEAGPLVPSSTGPGAKVTASGRPQPKAGGKCLDACSSEHALSLGRPCVHTTSNTSWPGW